MAVSVVKLLSESGRAVPESGGNVGVSSSKISEQIRVSFARYLFRESLTSARLLGENYSLLITDIDEKVHGSSQLTVFVQQWCRVRDERSTGSIRP